ncbi:HD domain-containing protein [Lachnospiraceae bacterium ZAX-1]
MDHDTKRVKLIKAMTEYEADAPHRVAHFMKVYGFTQTICNLENVDEDTRLIVETTAIIHDIGIRPALIKYGSSAGTYQQELGTAPTRDMLSQIGFSEQVIDRACFLVSQHHSYSNIEGLDYQILVEADFLVNILEEEMLGEAVKHVYDNIFKTKSGKWFCKTMYMKN